ncbi:MAG TPA: ABC transporter ATP-binding protein [Anaeromyxobacteraceae bacterium]|nr:ABC transporter ATP-binding protein [Anaeromyxobacteraceae bacterium]
MIEVVDLWKSFGENAVLKGISLTIPRGRTYVVLGGSGSGKTVLMKHVIGLFKPDRGHVLIDGTNISALEGKPLNEARRVFGMVFQGAALFDSMTVFENVAFPLTEKSHRDRPPPDEVRARVIEKLRVVDLGEEVLDRWPSELSGGMRKRVGLARALVTDPQIVLYDEPTTGLDPITTDYVDQMIKGAKEKLGITSMVISHDIASAFNVADRLAVLYDGHLVAEGTPTEIRASEHPFVKKFLSTWFEKQ